MGDKVNILLVDDRQENLLALRAVLESENYELMFASSGEEALKFVLKHDFAVILLDVQMPGLNGFETADIIKERESSKHIPIIFITAISQASEHVSKGYSKGAVDYIFKPFNPHVLKSKVEVFVQLYKKQRDVIIQRNHLEEKTVELYHGYKNLERIISDKTRELVETNKELEISQEHFKKIFQFSPNLMAIRSVKDKRYLNVNKSWCQFSGFDIKDVEGKTANILNFKAIIEMSDNGKQLDLVEGLFNVNITYKTKSGEIREGLLSTEASTINGEACIISAVTDITDSKKLEKQISRLERLNLVGEMAAGIAHEIRNPMTTVLGFLQLSKHDQKKQETREYFNLMIDELNRANSIITEYLSLAKDKATHKQYHDINTIIRALSPLLQADAIMNGKAINLELNDCPEIYIDEKEIRQLILNLGINGLEAMTESGVLTIRTKAEENNVVLEIQDEGPGISDEIMESVGTPFFTTKENGTGLGLAICFSVVSRHSAEIDISTSPKGTTFTITFPKKLALSAVM